MSTQTKLNIEGFAELVEELANSDSPNKAQLGSLVGCFRNMVMCVRQLQALKAEGKGAGSDAEGLMLRLWECQKEVRGVFAHFCAANGKTVEEVYHYVDDPENYTQEEWEDVQAIRRRVEEKATHSASSGFDWARPKKINKKEGG
ncbi:MAG: hypothetical protein KGZ39_01100 [Simkania sp.]|nr:hypothetical protein [Simkania sp.]